MSKRVFKYRIKEGAYQVMIRDLVYSEQGYSIKDGSLCCITGFASHTESYLKSKVKALENPILYQILIHNSDSDQEALIYPSLLVELDAELFLIE